MHIINNNCGRFQDGSHHSHNIIIANQYLHFTLNYNSILRERYRIHIWNISAQIGMNCSQLNAVI